MKNKYSLFAAILSFLVASMSANATGSTSSTPPPVDKEARRLAAHEAEKKRQKKTQRRPNYTQILQFPSNY